MQLFNIRVYGILINEANQILVSDEKIRGSLITKFPGGGLEFGEGTRDCLKREFMEEMNLEVIIGEHFYTTDFFQMSSFNKEHQIVSIYYKVLPQQSISVALKTIPFDFDESQLAQYEQTGETETFRFIDKEQFSLETMTLPIDKVVATMIMKTFI